MPRYLDTLEGVRPQDLEGFFVGWPSPLSPETHWRVLAGSDHVLLARDEASCRVVGFVTAISDGVLSAYIPLLEVLPAWQRQGIGTELLRRMLAKLEGLYMVDLVCDPNRTGFYERFGLRPYTAMIRRDTASLAGPIA